MIKQGKYDILKIAANITAQFQKEDRTAKSEGHIMNKKLLFIAASAVILLSAFSVKSYLDSTSPTEKEYSILTPESDIQLADDTSATIDDGRIPLSDEPDSPGDGSNGSSPDNTDSSQPVPANEDPNIQKIVDLVNTERARAGLPALTKDPLVCSAADIRAQEIYTTFAHERPDGSKYKTALDQVGASYRGSGENVAYGYRTADAVMTGWMNSEGHRNNILNEKFTAIGVGYYKGSNGYCYWSQMFTY